MEDWGQNKRIMPDKPLNLRQSLFVKYYLDRDTKGVCEASMLKAGYKPKYAHHWNTKILDNIGIKEAIEYKQAVIEVKEENSRELVTRNMFMAAKICLDKGDLTGYIRIMENLGKNCGWYEADNEQQRERTELNEQQQADLDEFIAWKHRQMLRGA